MVCVYDLSMKLEDVIKRHVLKVLRKAGSQKKAAKILGITDRTIRNYLTRWGVKRNYQWNGAGMREPTSKAKDEWYNRDGW